MKEAIGIDIGYGYTKSCSSRGKQFFPTTVTEMIPQGGFSKLSPVKVGEKHFLVGEEALREGKFLIDTRTTTFIKSPAWLAVLGHALSINNFCPEKNLIVLGLPPGQYSRELSEELAAVISKTTFKHDEKEYSVPFFNIRIIPQGAGIFFYYVAVNPQDFRDDIAVVDIGHYTLDMVMFSKGKYVEGAARSEGLGISMLLDEICRAFNKEFGLTIRHHDAYKILKYGGLNILGETYRISHLDEIISTYTAQLSTIIDEFFENLSCKPRIGLVAGGGALALKGNVSLKYKLYMLDTPEFANAIGYWYYGKEVVS